MLAKTHSQFYVTIIKYVVPGPLLYLRETYYIAFFNASYNIHLYGGSPLGRIVSDITRKKMSSSKKGELNSQFGVKLFGSDNPFFGKIHSDQSRLNMSISKGTRVIAYKDGNLFKEFYSLNLVAKELGISRPTIAKYASNGSIYMVGGVSWRFVLVNKS